MFILFPTSFWRVLAFGCALPPPPTSSSRRPPATSTFHTTLSPHNLLTHNLLTHNLSPHNWSPHNLSTHNLLTHNMSPHNIFTHNLSPRNLSTHPHTQLAHTQLVTTQLTHTHNLSTHKLLTHGCWCGRRGTWWHRPSLCVAGVALGDIDRHFAWQAWHLVTLTFTLCGRRGTWWHRPSLCMAGVALRGRRGTYVTGLSLMARLGLPRSPRLLAWQAWHLVTLTFTLCGRRGTWWHRSSLCVAGVALNVLDWLWWRAWVSRGRRGCWRGRCGTWWQWLSLCVAGVALGDINRHFAWPAWLCVAGVALMSLDCLWWRAWVSHGRRGCCRGRRGTYRTGLALVARCGAWVSRGRRGCWRGRRGTWWHRPSFCVAGIALGDIDLDFAWQGWHVATLTFTLRGRRGTWWRLALVARLGALVAAAVCVAGVALGDIDPHFAW